MDNNCAVCRPNISHLSQSDVQTFIECAACNQSWCPGTVDLLPPQKRREATRLAKEGGWEPFCDIHGHRRYNRGVWPAVRASLLFHLRQSPRSEAEKYVKLLEGK